MSEQHPEIGTGPAETPVADRGRQLAHVRTAEKFQEDLIRRMTPGRRLQIAQELYDTAWQIKEAGLRRQYPDWSDDVICAKCRRIFLTGYAGA